MGQVVADDVVADDIIDAGEFSLEPTQRLSDSAVPRHNCGPGVVMNRSEREDGCRSGIHLKVDRDAAVQQGLDGLWHSGSERFFWRRSAMLICCIGRA